MSGTTELQLGHYSFGMGDRFAHQARAQLRACVLAAEHGCDVIPVWNKSYREHSTIGSTPPSVRQAAIQAIAELHWDKPFHVDADHINLNNVDGFLESSDFFTIDVAEAIGKPAAAADVDRLMLKCRQFVGDVTIAGIEQPLSMTESDIRRTAEHYLSAVQQAGQIYRHIEQHKGRGQFITEVSMDETENPQTPAELLVILAALAEEKVPLQTIAPKFSGRFNKGVDYLGDLEQFENEFRADLAVIAQAIGLFDLPSNLKLSVHSGSDKFSIYAPMRRALQEFGAGLHIKTAGTTWLEELIGLAEAGGGGLTLAKQIYADAYARCDSLCAPYAAVIDIRVDRLPRPETVRDWSVTQYTAALRHDPSNTEFNPDVRQLLHVGYKIAAELGPRYLGMLDACEESISRNVTLNLFDRHMKPLFVG